MIFCARQLQEQACEQQQALFFYYRRYVEFAIIIGYWPVGSGKNKSAETVKKKKRVNGLAPFLLLTYILVFLPRFQFYQCKLFFFNAYLPLIQNLIAASGGHVEWLTWSSVQSNSRKRLVNISNYSSTFRTFTRPLTKFSKMWCKHCGSTGWTKLRHEWSWREGNW